MSTPVFRQMAHTAWLVAGLTLVTVAHGAYRMSASSSDLPPNVIDLPVGATFPHLDGELVVGERSGVALGDGRCRIVVVFATDCPYCRAAAERERAAASLVGARLPVVWITPDDVGSAARFHGEFLPRTTEVWHAPASREALRVNGVPAAVLVDEGQVVRDAWAYSGDEAHSELARSC